MTIPSHLYDEARSLAGYCSGTALIMLLVMMPAFDSTGVRGSAQLAGTWVPLFAGLYVLVNALAFSRQGGFRRAVPQLVGIALPGGLTLLFGAGYLSFVLWLVTLLLCLPLWAAAFLYGYRLSGRLDKAALAARSLKGWRRHIMGTDPALGAAAELLHIAPDPDPWFRGEVAGHPATFASRVTSFVPVASPVDVPSFIANFLRWFVLLVVTREAPEGEYQELLARPASWILVDLPESATVVPDFRVVSRRWTDRDIVFGNVRDRSETFESVELHRHYSVRMHRDADRLHTWQAFNVELVERLSGTAHLVIAKKERHLIVLRLHGAMTPAEVDQLHTFTEELTAEILRVGRTLHGST